MRLGIPTLGFIITIKYHRHNPSCSRAFLLSLPSQRCLQRLHPLHARWQLRTPRQQPENRHGFGNRGCAQTKACPAPLYGSLFTKDSQCFAKSFESRRESNFELATDKVCLRSFTSSRATVIVSPWHRADVGVGVICVGVVCVDVGGGEGREGGGAPGLHWENVSVIAWHEYAVAPSEQHSVEPLLT